MTHTWTHMCVCTNVALSCVHIPMYGVKTRLPNHWRRGTTTVHHLCQCCQVLWWDPLWLSDSASSHHSHPRLLFSSSSTSALLSTLSPHLLSKRTQIIWDAAAPPFFFPLQLFIHFKTYRCPFSIPASVYWFEYMLLLSIHYDLSFVLNSFLRMMNLPFCLSESPEMTLLCEIAVCVNLPPAPPLSCSPTNTFYTKSKPEYVSSCDFVLCILICAIQRPLQKACAHFFLYQLTT